MIGFLAGGEKSTDILASDNQWRIEGARGHILAKFKNFFLIYTYQNDFVEFVVLPVATASVERTFSAVKIIKTNLYDKMGDDFLVDSLVCYIRKNVFKALAMKLLCSHFQK